MLFASYRLSIVNSRDPVQSFFFLLRVLYCIQVDKAKEEFKVGNLFEVVLSQTFKKPCTSRCVSSCVVIVAFQHERRLSLCLMKSVVAAQRC